MSNTTSFRRISWLLACGLAFVLGARAPADTPVAAAPQPEVGCSDAPARLVRQEPVFGYCTE